MSEEKAIISYDDFVKLDLRIAKVIEASEHPNADKLLCLQIDLGGEQRQIIAGIKGHYEPAELVGKEILVVANLAPRKMRGIESHGMLLAAVTGDDENRSVIVITPDKTVPAGTVVS